MCSASVLALSLTSAMVWLARRRVHYYTSQYVVSARSTYVLKDMVIFCQSIAVCAFVTGLVCMLMYIVLTEKAIDVPASPIPMESYLPH